jgi:hypothetical protein
MSWPINTAVSELRTLLHDGPTDKYRHRKRVFGQVNGTNLRFKTLEYRRVTDFSDAAAVYPLGVFVNETLLAPASVPTDFIAEGEFTLLVAPVDGDVVSASYYIQYFTDAELTTFMENAAKWLIQTADTTNLDACLQQSALRYGAYEAYQKLAMRFIERLSETYRLSDQPDPDRQTLVTQFKSLADDFFKQAVEVRNDCYGRSGKNLQPSWGFSQGRIMDPQPKK